MTRFRSTTEMYSAERQECVQQSDFTCFLRSVIYYTDRSGKGQIKSRDKIGYERRSEASAWFMPGV